MSHPHSVRTLAVLLVSGVAAGAGAQSYHVTDPVPGTTLSPGTIVSKILESGELLGTGGPTTPGVLVVDSAGMTLLPLLPFVQFGGAAAASDPSHIVGSCGGYGSGYPPVGWSTAVLWRFGVPIDLNSLVTGGPPLELISASGINAGGDIIGTGSPGNAYRAYRLRQGIVTDLGTLMPGGTGSAEPTAIDEAGRVVGAASAPGGQYHAFLWDNGVMTDLHDAAVIQGGTSAATDIDRFGRICGGAVFASGGVGEAALWDHGQIVNLGTLQGLHTTTYGMNDLGEIVGSSWIPNVAGISSHAFLWKNGAMVDLNSLIPPGSGVTLTWAVDVDNHGRIVAEAMPDPLFTGAQSKRVILQPVCAGGSVAYGTGCPGTGGATPVLATLNCPTPGNTFALTVADGKPSAMSLLCIGSGTGVAPIVPTCALQVLPLVATLPPFPLDAKGAAFLPATVPAGTSPFVATLQLLCADAGGNGGISATRPLQLTVQ